jgi:hypothetical protein
MNVCSCSAQNASPTAGIEPEATCCDRALRAMPPRSSFKTEGKYKMYMWTGNDPSTIQHGKAAMRELMREGMRKSTVDLSGVKMVSEGVLIPFGEATGYRTAYGWVYRNLQPLLEKVKVEKSMWQWWAQGDPVAEEVAESASSGLPPALPMLPTDEVTNPSLYPPSVPLKISRGFSTLRILVGRWGSGVVGCIFMCWGVCL